MSITPDLDIADVARKARDVIATQGWLRGDIWTDGEGEGIDYSGGPVCLIGGLMVGQGMTTVDAKPAPLFDLTRHALEVYILDSDRLGDEYTDEEGWKPSPIPTFNDHAAKSKDDVLTLLDEFIAKTTPDQSDGGLL